MATQKLNTVAGNTAPPLVITATRDGSAISLVDATTVALVITSSGVVTNGSHQNCVITTPASGIVTYTRQTGDLPTRGTYICDLKVTYADNTVEILYDQLKIKARAAAGT